MNRREKADELERPFRAPITAKNLLDRPLPTAVHIPAHREHPFWPNVHIGEWEKLAEELEALRKVAVEGRQQGEAGMSREATSFYDHIANEAFGGEVPASARPRMRALMEAIVETQQHSIGSIDFWHNADKQKRTRSEIKAALTLTGIPEIKSNRERIAVEIMKLAKNRHDALLQGSESRESAS